MWSNTTQGKAYRYTSFAFLFAFLFRFSGVTSRLTVRFVLALASPLRKVKAI
ncbi:hypothetical protein [Avibacterium paragallinarum]|uniref:hypothetical protein n=1 Tax=Avibacterium paragallinarum TaxID=728 RepID=UPI000AA222DC|nr:hypothetical protein [Avibacterium paragallinarum]